MSVDAYAIGSLIAVGISVLAAILSTAPHRPPENDWWTRRRERELLLDKQHANRHTGGRTK